MPLVIMCGRPCSGKTLRAQQIAAHLRAMPETRDASVHVVNEESLHQRRDEAYADSSAERMARGALKSEVERLLTAEAFVICDSMNYIKGFRYELFARARALNTQSCVVLCDTPVEACRAYKAARAADADRYGADALLDDLSSRLESPSDRVKWDRPLFVVEEKEDAPVAAICTALVHGKAAKASLATTPQRLADTNFLFELDGVTQDVEKALVALLPTVEIGGILAPLPHTSEKVCIKNLQI